MTVALPLGPLARQAEVRFIDFGSLTDPVLGGAVQRIDRLGSRFGLKLTYPRMNHEDASVLISRILRGSSEGAEYPFPQGSFVPGNAGVLKIRTFTPAQTFSLPLKNSITGYSFKEGQFLHVKSSGRNYIHNITAAAVVGGAGTANIDLSVYPAIRTDFAVDDDVSITPILQGFPSGDRNWTIDEARKYGISLILDESE